MDSNIYVYINGAKTSLLSLAASSGISYATILARYKAGVAPESLTAGAKAVLDTTPTNGSTNGITSGAVFTAVQSLASDISGLDTDKIDKVSGATAGHSAIMTAAGGVADAGYIPYRKVLLWENASPSSSFPPQDISVDLSGYDRYGIDFGDATTNTRSVYNETVATSAMYVSKVNGAVASVYASRVVTPSGASISIGAAYYGGSSDPNNTQLIPLRIYGIKGVG